MAQLLYRLGRFGYRRRWPVIAAWALILAGAVAAGIAFSGPREDSFTIPGTESQEALDRLGREFPEVNLAGASARVVIAAPPGQTLDDPGVQERVQALGRDLSQLPGVAYALDPFAAGAISPDRRVGIAEVSFVEPAGQLDAASKRALEAAVEHARAAGLTVEVGGDALREFHAGSTGEILGVAVAAVVLFLSFGSLVAAGLPLISAFTGVGIGIAGIAALSGFTSIGTNTPTLAMMLGLAVGIDYAMFILSRFRHEVASGRSPEEAAGWANGTAGSAVVFAGLTVVIALCGLAVVNVPLLTQMGLAAAATVSLAVLIAVTLLPALLGAAGRFVAGRAVRDPESHGAGAATGLAARWAGLITRRPWAAAIGGMALLGIVAIPALDVRLALPDDGMAAPGATQRKAYDLVKEAFGPGFNGPLVVIVDAAGGEPAAAGEAAAAQLRALPGVVAVSPPTVNPAGTLALLRVIPAGGPADAATADLVHAIRAQARETGASLAVTGQTAIQVDFSERVGAAFLPYVGVVVGLALVLLLLVFRSVAVPVKAAAGFLFTIAATLGAVVAVFQWGWLAPLFGVDQEGPILSLMPIFLVGVLFGLAMDYEVFLVTRMREEHVHGLGEREAIVYGFQHSARVVTAAALIMLSVFAGFILASETLIKMMGFALALGIAFDAFIVRMTIVPAVLALLGRAAWWMPAWLERLLPKVDVEGTGLRNGDAARAYLAENAGVPGPAGQPGA